MKFIVDANLPYYFSLWNNRENYIHVYDINLKMNDDEIWNYAKENNLTIITKDKDFSNRILFNTPPPKVIHLKIGNLKLKSLFNYLSANWNTNYCYLKKTS
jgi:predicted nuclease of predicted toxin-antitoxin system